MVVPFINAISFYTSISLIFLKYLNDVTHIIIDEQFHIPQGLAYCNFDFSTWDSKITTLPGLYIFSALMLGPLKLCSIYWLRFFNVVIGIFNFCLFVIWYTICNENRLFQGELYGLASSLNLALLPPLFFFAHVYYTDVLSIMFILLLLIFNKSEYHALAAICGLFSVGVRQTNIIWVGMLFSEYLLKQFCYYCINTQRRKTVPFRITEWDIKELSFKNLGNLVNLKNVPLRVWFNIYVYLTTILLFVMFVIMNGGIVVGDKTAHVVRIHIPQLFYFSLFCIVFGWPHFLHLIKPFFKFVGKNIFSVMLIVVVMLAIVYFNTLVHPYLLADNRHYTFYIWHRFYEGIAYFRYLMVPVYLFGLYSIICSVYSTNDVGFTLVYVPCTTAVLILQRMIEIRYFLIPYIILRMRIQCQSTRVIFLELATFAVINLATIIIFFSKDIHWTDFDYAQKLIW